MNEPDISLSPEDQVVASALIAQRPAPTPTFRTELSRTIASKDLGYGHRPAHLWVRAGMLVGAGALLVLFGVLVSSGAI